MRRYPYIFLFLLFFPIVLGTACKSKDNTSAPPSENSIDAARNFIRAALDGKFEVAKKYMLIDSANLDWLNGAERSYDKADASIKSGYRAASINIIRFVEPIKDSVTLLIFSNTLYKENHDTLKIIKSNGQWLVDFKYLYMHHSDSLYQGDFTDGKN